MQHVSAHHAPRAPRAGLRAALLLGLSLSACPQCAPDTVGEGIARLTVRNVGAIASLVSADATCGFASAAAQASAVIDGTPGGIGTVTTRVEGCRIAPPEDVLVSEDCDGVQTRASGAVTVTASRTVHGLLTGDAANPVVPASADSVRLEIERASFEGFEVVKQGSDSFLRMLDGSVSAVLAPRLAAAADSGACAVATPHTTFLDVRYEPSSVLVHTADNEFEADVAGSDFDAQNGRGLEEENAIAGTLVVFDTEVDVTGDGVLDADYDAELFTASYACTEGLAQPESFACADLAQPLADGAARLSVQLLAALARLADANPTCGFASPAVAQTAALSGTVGGDGSLTLTMDACAIDIVAPATISEDCGGRTTTLAGRVTLSGTKVLTGRLTGDATNPIAPDDDTPARISIVATVEDLALRSSASEAWLLARSGVLSGSVAPRAARSTDTGVCSAPSPHAALALGWDRAELVVHTDAGSFVLPVDGAQVRASNGRTSDGENLLAGEMIVLGARRAVPSDGRGLDPAYDPAAFEAAWQCAPGLALPVSFACGLEGMLAAGAGALSMRTAATVASLVDANPACGFSSAAVAASASFAGGGVGDDDVTLTLDLGAGCTITLPPGTVIASDCAGHTTTVGGTVTVTGTKEVTGFFTGDPAEPIVPTGRDPARFTLSMSFDELEVASSRSTSRLIAHAGTLAATFAPRLGLDPESGVCSIPTHNARFTDVQWTDGDVTVVSDGAHFRIALDASDLDAVNGTLDAASNQLAGSIVVDGVQVPLSVPLDPAFDQADIDEATACVAMNVPLEAMCSFRQVLGNAAARLLVKGAAVATSALDANPACGFSAPSVLGAPMVTGAPGGPGALTFTAAADCGTQLPPDTTLAQDCLGVTTRAGGAFSVEGATKTVSGFLTGSPQAPLFPLSSTAARLALTGVALADWSAYDALPDGTVPARASVTGALDVTVRPLTGVSESASAAASAATGGAITAVFSHKTPVAAVEDLSMAEGAMTITVGAKTFRVALSDVALEALNGAWVGDAVVPAGENAIAGSLVIDGEPVDVLPGLVSGYQRALFEAGYFDASGTCNPDLLAPIAAE